MDIFYAGKTAINYIITLFKRDFCQKTDIVDDCVSNSTDKPLSAKQGKYLHDQIAQIDEVINIATLEEVKEYLNI